MEAFGPGSRGIVFAQRVDGGSHAFNAVNVEGAVEFLDGQVAAVPNTEGLFNFSIVRTDR